MKPQILFGLALLTGCDKLITYEPPPEKRVMDSEAQAMSDAKGLATKGDLEGAHGKLSQIAMDAPARRTPEFMEIENKWAEAHIAKADAEKDLTKKLALLQDVSKASNVSPELRATASNKIALAVPDPAIPAILVNYDPELAKANVAKCKELLIDVKNLKQVKELLAPRVFGGIGSPEEADMLLNVCASLKDKACLAQMQDAGVANADVIKALAEDKSPPCTSCPKK